MTSALTHATCFGGNRMGPIDADAVHRILDVMRLAERLKTELRHSWTSSGRHESVAEHSWQMALLAVLAMPHLEVSVDVARALKMVIVHDLVEAEAGDVPFFDTGEAKRTKAAREAAAMETIRGLAGPATGGELADLWEDFERRESPEARFASALDHLEVQIQHNAADLGTWEPVEYGLVYTKMDAACAVDPFLAALCEAVKDDAEAKMAAGGVDVEAVRARLADG